MAQYWQSLNNHGIRLPSESSNIQCYFEHCFFGEEDKPRVAWGSSSMLQPGAPSAHRLAKSGATLGFQDGPPFVGQQIWKNHDQPISTLTVKIKGFPCFSILIKQSYVQIYTDYRCLGSSMLFHLDKSRPTMEMSGVPRKTHHTMNLLQPDSHFFQALTCGPERRKQGFILSKAYYELDRFV